MGPGHNVFIHPSGSCDKSEAKFVGEAATTSYTFLPEDGTPEGNIMFFACDVGTHCDLGMQIQVTVFSEAPAGRNDNNGNQSVGEADLVQTKDIIVDYWTLPEPAQAFDPIDANVGDTIIFSWEDNQNVFIHPSKTCDPTSAIFVGTSSPAAYTFQLSDGSPEGTDHLFVSEIGSNCELGMQLLVKVFSRQEATSDGNVDSQENTAPSGSASIMSAMASSGFASALSLAFLIIGWI